MTEKKLSPLQKALNVFRKRKAKVGEITREIARNEREQVRLAKRNTTLQGQLERAKVSSAKAEERLEALRAKAKRK